MDLKLIDKKLNYSQDALNNICASLYERDTENRKLLITERFIKRYKRMTKVVTKRTNNGVVRFRRVFALCHPEEFHLALGLCAKCYWKQYRDNRPPSQCHPDKKEFRRGLCKQCYRKEKGVKW